ncbi:hypothetical protein BBOV_III004385 [Babesia bovis T2Bo]|uniref:hypothetical protein n=1 Tax=Babesia bovis T2Bo TaxID=484906 RepID=UPI001C35BF34|nr:hypothetical protein BBOV_III004385 [Babesia bovis T2Bo]KAG6440003.1 hypothetical protein BBOV_III004385 [Babesia bovis T2Bo]
MTMVSYKNRFMSINSSQHSKLKRYLDKLQRHTAREIKTRIKMARNELLQNDNSRILATAKNALVAYSNAIISGATCATESVSLTDKTLSKQKAVYLQLEKKNKSCTLKKEEAEFNTFINGLLRRVDKCCEGHRKADSHEEDPVDAFCGTKLNTLEHFK